MPTESRKISQDELKAVLDYNADTGTFVWRKRTGPRSTLGRRAGNEQHGYINIKIMGKTYKAHRLAWLWNYGYLPEHGIDHIDRDKTNNRIENLREVGQVCNQRNRGNSANNTSGVRGVTWAKKDGKWLAQIGVLGEIVKVGYHSCFLEAACHRLAAEQAINWAGCDSTSPALKYVQQNIASPYGK